MRGEEAGTVGLEEIGEEDGDQGGDVVVSGKKQDSWSVLTKAHTIRAQNIH